MTLCFNMLFALIMISYKNMKVKRKRCWQNTLSAEKSEMLKKYFEAEEDEDDTSCQFGF